MSSSEEDELPDLFSRIQRNPVHCISSSDEEEYEKATISSVLKTNDDEEDYEKATISSVFKTNKAESMSSVPEGSNDGATSSSQAETFSVSSLETETKAATTTKRSASPSASQDMTDSASPQKKRRTKQQVR